MKARLLVLLVVSGLLVPAIISYACIPPPNQPPAAHLTVVPEKVTVDVNVVFDARGSYDSDGYITKYEWDWEADGTYDYNETPGDAVTICPYTSIDLYTVGLRVTDDDGATGTYTCKVYVGEIFNITQETAYDTIQGAINDANDGDLIRVYPGIYNAIDFNDRKITVESSNPTDWDTVGATIIDANGSGNAVTFDQSEDGNSVLQGFTVTGGGTGIYCDGTSPTIRNCVIMDNDSSDNGGGVYCNGASPSITNVVMTGNNTRGNSGGGGVYCNNCSSSLKLVNCVFSKNSSAGGGGVYNNNSSPTLTNCTFSGNSAGGYGGGIYNYSSSPTVANCILWGDAGSGGEIYNDSNSSNPTVSYSCIDGGYTGTGNIDSDPNFAEPDDPEGPDGIFGSSDDGLYIMHNSPCIDAANGDATDFEPSDITDQSRHDMPFADGNGVGDPNYADMGAYESRMVWYVKKGSQGGDGRSWGTAFGELWEALSEPNLATDHEIWVSKGTYLPTDGNDATIAFSLTDGVRLYGGFSGTETTRWQRNWQANQTILSGDIGTPGVNSDNSYNVVTMSERTRIEGFIIEKGNDTQGYSTGGGIYYYAQSGVSVVKNCVIRDNYADYGGGLDVEGSAPLEIEGCYFIHNEGYYGGALSEWGSGSSVINCVFSDNSSSLGGAIYNDDYYGEGTLSLINCTLVNNLANNGGGGLYLDNYYGPAIANVDNCIFWGNTDNDGVNADESAQIKSSTCPVVKHSCIQGWTGSWGGEGNIGGEQIGHKPKFTDKHSPAGKDAIFGTADDGLSLHTNSPCVDKGSDMWVPVAATSDVTGAPRITDGDHTTTSPDTDEATVDMGAYELATTWYVDCNVSGGNNDGTSWTDAYDDLQDALSDANILGGDEIWVAEGTYKPTTDPNRDISFVLVPGVAVYGGFDATETTRRQRNWAENETILSGDIDGNNVNDVPDSNNSYHVVKGADGAVLDGFEIIGGNADGSGADSSGGGIYCDDAPMRINHCTIVYNWASSYGGGMYNNGSSSKVTNCLFSGNRAGNDGGGIYNKGGSDAKLINCTITGNKASGNGGGVYSYQSSPTLTNCVVWNNMDGGGIDEPAQISGSVESVTYSCIQDSNANDANIPFGGSANHNMDDDPCFVDGGYWDWRKVGGSDFGSGDTIAVDPCKVTIYDFSKLHDNFNRGSDIVPEYDGHPTNEGFVKSYLEIDDACDIDGHPAHKGASKTTSAENKMEGWFNADSAAHKNPTPWEAVVVPDWQIINPDTGLFEFKSGGDCNFFPVDDPNFDWENFNHNYFFTFQYRDECTYIPGHQTEFKASDDLFVYINGKLVIDRGGLWGAPNGNYGCWSHTVLELIDGKAKVYDISLYGPNSQPVATIPLSLSEGDTYHFDVFFANRDATRSIFQMQAAPVKMQLYYIVGDYHLEPDSNCIDAGDNNAVLPGGGTDLGVYPRFLGTQSIVDMGAYEYGVNQQPADVNAGTYWAITVADSKIYLGNAYFTDDGLPVPPGEVTITWDCVNYPNDANVTFDDPNDLGTYVRGLTLSGDYTLELTVDDGSLYSTDTTIITVENYAPQVEAGNYGAITVAQGYVYLGGAYVTDNTLPIPPNSLTTLWECIGYPNDANVTFDNANAVNTTVRGLTVSGTYTLYTLKLTANDGELDANDTATITVQNYAPQVEAGADKAITLPYETEVHLSDAYVTDNTLPIPPNSLTINWSCANNCPGSVTFDNPNEPNTWVRDFSVPGTYTLRLEADDGELSASDDVNIVVNQELIVEAGSDKTINLPVHKATLYGAYITGASGNVDVTWLAVSCSVGANINAVEFDNNSPGPNNVVTGVTLPEVVADYVLQLSVDNGQTVETDVVKITIGEGPGSDNHDPPQVEAGDYNAITLPEVLHLNDAWVTDDGKPYGMITTQWSTVRGTAGGVVTLDDCKSVNTTAEFSMAGTYTLMLQASDGEKDANDLTVITVNPDPNKNDPPEVYAGSDHSADLEVGGLVVDFDTDLTEEPNVSDDGLPNPPGTVTTQWSVPVGDITAVSFSDITAVKPVVTFTKTGTYVLQLEADDGEFSVIDEMKVTVNLPSGYDAPEVSATFSGERECDCTGGRHKEGEITLPEMAYLYGDVTEGTYTVSTRWLMVSGPSSVTFGAVNNVNTTAKFSWPGEYVLQLKADDGMAPVSDEVTVTVKSRNRLGGGEAHTLIIDKKKKVWSCGPNRLYGSGHNGSLLGVGVNVDYDELFLTQVHGPNDCGQLENIEVVAAGAVHSSALDFDRYVWSWGDNSYGELGIGIADYKNAPVKVRTCNLIYDPCQYPDSNGFDNRFISSVEDVDAVHVLDNGNIILSTETSASIGGLTFDSEDLVEYDPVNDVATKFVDGIDRGITKNIDAVYVCDDPNFVIFSTSGDYFSVGGTQYYWYDLVKLNRDTNDFSKFFNGDAYDFHRDIDAVHVLDNNNIILSVTGEAALGGISFKDNALIEFNPDTADTVDGLEPNTARLYFAQAVSMTGSGIDAAFITDANDIIFSTDVDDMLGELSFKKGDLVKCAVDIGYLEDVLDISAGRSGRHTLAVKSDGSVWAWGRNRTGQIGIDKSAPQGAQYWEDENVFVPVQVFGYDANGDNTHSPDEGYLKNIVAVAAGVSHSMALEKLDDANDNCSGTVYIWGGGAESQLGSGYSGSSSYYRKDIPVKVHAGEQDPNYDYFENVTYLRNIVAISAGWYTSMALEKLDPCDPNCNGRVYTWGTVSGGGNQGLLGDGEHDISDLAIIVCAGEQDPNHPADSNYPLNNIVAISAGEGHFMALDVNGHVWTWGSNRDPETGGSPDSNSGHLGNGTWYDANTPVKVVAPDRDRDGVRDDLDGDGDPNNDYLGDDIPIVIISAGYWHSLAMDEMGTIYSWGYGNMGRLGLGSENNYNIPQVVIMGARVHNMNKDRWYNQIQVAIDGADDGDTLVANEGTYYEYIDFGSKSVTLTSSDPNDWDIVANTIIYSPDDNHDVVKFLSGSSATIAGFTITRGEDGIYCYSASPTIRNNIIKNNFGAGIYCTSGGTPNIINNWITANGLYWDASGIHLSSPGGSTVIRNNTIVQNIGFGIWCKEQLDVDNCIVWKNGDNSSSSNLYDDHPGDIIDASYCAVGGWSSGGTGNFDPCDPCFVNAYDFADITKVNGTTATIKVEESASKYEVNDVIEIGDDGIVRTITDVNENAHIWIITFEPNLSSASVDKIPIHNWGVGATDIDEDWHIKAESVCRNKGNPSGNYTGEVDIDGEPRELLGRVDVGADEYAPLSVDAGADKEVIIGQKLYLTDADVTDDPCDTTGTVTVVWWSDPNTGVTFSPNDVVDTNVTFDQVGIYTVHLDGYKDYSDGNGAQLAGGDTLTVTVNPWAGENKTIYWPDNHADLNDANATGADSWEWVQVWGTADVEFVNDTNAFSLHPEVNFPDVGIYGLELLAKDNQGYVIGSDTVWISVLMQMIYVDPGSYPAITLSADGTATLKLASTVSGAIPFYTYWIGPESAVFDDPCDLDTDVTFTTAGVHPLELRAYDQSNQIIGAAVTWITVYGASVVDAGEYGPITWPANSVTLDGRIVSGDPDWTEWIADVNYVSFDDPCKLDAQATFSEPAVYQLRLTAYDMGVPIGEDDVWITVNPVDVNASLNAGTNVDDGQIIFPNKADLYALSPTPGTLPDGVTMEWDEMSGYVTINQISGWEYATAQFDYPGSYYITLVAKKNDKVLAWDTLHITVGQPSGVVDAGPDKVISLSQSPLQLTGTIVGTELPDVNYLWSLSSYEGPDPCGVTFAPNDSNDANVTQATFYTTGVYGLLFRVYTGENLLGWDTVEIAVSNNNQAPIVRAGYRKMGVVNSPIKLYDAMVWDENDIGDLTLLWEVDFSPSGSSVIFDPNYTEPNDSNQLDPNVTFDAVGPYALKLTATDPCNNSGTGYLEVLIGTATQQTVISAGKDKTIILPQYSMHLADAWVFPALTDDMTVQWTAPNVPDGGYVGFIDLADVNEDPCDSISILRPLVTFSQNKDANEVVTGDYVLELTLSIPNEPNGLTDRVTITVANSDATDPIIATFYATIDGNSIDNDSNLEGLIDILVVVEDEDLNDVTLELDQTRIINPDNTEVLEGVLGSIQKMRLTYSIHTSQIATTADNHSLTVTATDMADNNGTEQIDFHIKEASIIEPIARISGWEDEGASQTYGFAEEPEPTTVIGKGLFRLIGAAYNPSDSNASVDYKIELFTTKIGDAPVEYWNPSYQIYHECFVKNLTGDGFLSGPIGSDSTDDVLAGPDPNLDLTGVENGSYQLLLTAKSGSPGNYQYSYAHVGFVLDTQLKLGNVKFTQEDLIIPVGGIALRVTRTYDSLNRHVDGDFGYGWSYSIANMDIELNENRMTLESFTEWGEYTSVRFDSNYNRNVTLTLPNGQRATFIFYLESVHSQYGNQYAPNNYQAKYASPPGVAATLETKEPEIMDAFGFWSSVWGSMGAIAYQDNYDFSGLVLTTEDGTTYHIERKKYASGDGYDMFWYHGQMLTAKPYGPPYLSHIETASGEEIDFNVNKTTLRIGDIEHKDKNDNVTKTIQIEYEQGNIVKIRAPSEQGGDWPTLQYDYDSSGNLTAVHRLIDGTTGSLDFDGRYQTITYDYNDPCGVFGPGEHYVFDIQDERGISPIMYYYDDDGLLEAVRDARGNRIELSHDLGAKKETVTDRSGNLKIYYYDDRGNVLRESAIVDANERILTEYEYDYQPSGKPGEFNYDPGNPDKPSAVKMPLVDSPDPCDSNDWSITEYVYDAYGRTTEVNDPMGNVTGYDYDSVGNILETSQYLPNAQGGTLVNKTVNEYDSGTSLLKKTQVKDASGNVLDWTEYFYDNKNHLTDVNKVDANDLSEINVTHYTYDNDGNFPSSPNSITDAAGFAQNFDYDKNGNQTKSWYNWVDLNDAGRSCTVTTINEYDAAGRVTRTLRDVNGGIQEYTIVLSETIYNSIGKPDTVHDQFGNATVYSYDETGNPVEILVYDPCGTLLTISEMLYDKEGRVLVSVDAHDPNEAADGTENVYDELGRVIETCRWSDVDVNLVDLVVDGNVVGRKLANDAEPNNAWEGSGEPPSGLNFGWTVNDGNLPVVGNELSHSITEYDLLGRVKMSISLDEDGYEWPTSYEYDAAGKQIAVYDPCGHDITWDANGVIISAEPNAALGHRTETQYLGTRRWKVTDARGFETGADPNDYTTGFVYDALGRVVTTIHPPTEFEGNSGAEPTYTHTAYDYFGRRVWQSEQTMYANGNDPNILSREFRYDDAGRLTNTVLPDVNDPCNNDTPTYPRYDYYYDDYGNLTAIQDYIKEYYDYTVDSNYARETKFTYNPLHKQLTRRLPDGKTEYKYYDEFGRIIKAVDFKGQVTGFEYNVRGLLEFKNFYANDTLYTSDDPNMLYEYTYDNLGRKLSVEVNDLDAVTVDTYQYDYDAEGRVVEVNTPQGVVYYDYNDITGRKDSTWTDETDTQYDYDELGRLKTAELVKCNGSTVSEPTAYEYTAVGSRWKMHLPNGVTTAYVYDNSNRLLSVTHEKSGQLAKYDYALKADGMRQQLTEDISTGGGRTVGYTYDNLNRVITESASAASGGYDIEYTYDVVGNRTKRVISANGQCMRTDYEYNDRDQLVKETHTDPGVCFWLHDKPVYAYTSNGQITHYRLFGSSENISSLKAYLLGIPTKWSNYAMATIFGLLAVILLLPAALRIINRRERKGRRIVIPLRQFLIILLAYLMLIDPAYLQQEARASINYASLGTANWGTINRDIHYYYDENGSCVKKIEAVKDTADPDTNFIEKTVYEYNLQNRLEEVKITTDGVNWDITTYKYNDDGIRVEKNDNGTITKYLIDSYNHTGYAQVLEEWDTTSTPTLIKTYVIGDDVIGDGDNSGTLKYYLYDGQGSVRHHSDTSGNLVTYSGCDTFAYDAYGQRVDPLKDSINEGLFYTGEQWDNSAKQYYLRARYYDPLTGRFNRMDPFAGNNQDPQSLHKYLYAHNNPVNNIDPSGMMTLAGLLFRVGIGAILTSMLLSGIHGSYSRAKTVAARVNRDSVFNAIFKGAFTWNDWKQVILGFGAGADAGAINALDTLTFRLVVPIHEYRDDLWYREGLDESWVGSATNVFAWAGTASLYTAAAVWAWNAAGWSTMDVAAVNYGKQNFWLHLQFGSNGVWKEARGQFGQTMDVIYVSSGDLSASQLTGIPVQIPQAIFDANYAHNCVTAVLSAFARGWGWPY